MTMRIECPGCSFSAQVPEEEADNYATCPRCRTRFLIADPVAAGSVQLVREPCCPVCREERLQASGDPLESAECSRCLGSFLPGAGMLKLVGEHLGLDPAILDSLENFSRSEPLSCPACGESMKLLKLRGVDVDQCTSCRGLWLDAGELYRLSAGHYGSERAREAPTMEGTARQSLEPLLTSHRTLTIKHDPEMSLGTMLTGWNHASFYDLRGPLQSLGIVREKGEGLGATLLRNFAPGLRTIEAQVLDRSGQQVLLELRRPPTLLASNMSVRSGVAQRTIGSVQQHLNPLIRGYDLKDAAGRRFGRITSPLWRAWTFKLYDESGQERGSIKKRWTGLRQEYYTRGDDFELNFGESGEHGWSLDQRSIVLAAAISIDLDHFERRGAA